MNTIIVKLAVLWAFFVIALAGCVTPAAAFVPPCGPGCHLEFDHGVHCVCPPPGCHYSFECHGWPPHCEWVLTCPPTPPPAPSASVSYLPVYVADIWSHRCTQDDLAGPYTHTLPGNHNYLVTFTDQYGLDGSGVCYGVTGGGWNLHADEQRLAGMAVSAFPLPVALIGLQVRASPMMGNGPIRVQIQNETAMVYDQSFPGEVNETFGIT